MHGSSLCRMAWFVENWLKPDPGPLRVLDVGSCEVAGGSYRRFFPKEQFEYVGLDLAPGKNVDIVPALPYHWPEIAADSFDVVISGQAFEHMEFFWLAALEMARCLKSGGLMCLVAPRGFERHRYPVDCYRFDADGMLAIARWCQLEPLHVSTDMAPANAPPDWHIENCEDSLLVARKPQDWSGPATAMDYFFRPADMDKLATGFQICKRPLLKAEPEIAPTPEPDNHAAYEKVIAEMALELGQLRSRVEQYENSNSWRLTRPLRKLGKLARTMFTRNGSPQKGM